MFSPAFKPEPEPHILPMVAVNSTMLPLGTQAPDFSLPDPSGKRVSLKDLKGSRAVVVIFMCNHCPYVKHIRAGLQANAPWPADSIRPWGARYRKSTFSRSRTTR